MLLKTNSERKITGIKLLTYSKLNKVHDFKMKLQQFKQKLRSSNWKSRFLSSPAFWKEVTEIMVQQIMIQFVAKVIKWSSISYIKIISNRDPLIRAIRNKTLQQEVYASYQRAMLKSLRLHVLVKILKTLNWGHKVLQSLKKL